MFNPITILYYIIFNFKYLVNIPTLTLGMNWQAIFHILFASSLLTSFLSSPFWYVPPIINVSFLSDESRYETNILLNIKKRVGVLDIVRIFFNFKRFFIYLFKNSFKLKLLFLHSPRNYIWRVAIHYEKVLDPRCLCSYQLMINGISLLQKLTLLLIVCLLFCLIKHFIGLLRRICCTCPLIGMVSWLPSNSLLPRPLQLMATSKLPAS